MLLYHFEQSFQFTHDCWIVLLGLDFILAGLVWCRPLQTIRRAAAWGCLGGICALISPTIGFVFGIMSCANSWKRGLWRQLVVAAGMAMLAVCPWIIRNYLVLGRFIPVKSNLAFELYQSQCSEPTGVLSNESFAKHPYGSSDEHEEFKHLGEMAYLDRKKDQFLQSVSGHPWEYADRVKKRFLAATIQYYYLNPSYEIQRPWLVRLWRQPLRRQLSPQP